MTLAGLLQGGGDPRYPTQEPGWLKPQHGTAAGQVYTPDDVMRAEQIWQTEPIIADEYGGTSLPASPMLPTAAGGSMMGRGLSRLPAPASRLQPSPGFADFLRNQGR